MEESQGHHCAQDSQSPAKGFRSQGEMLCREVVVAVESSRENPDDSACPLVSFLAVLSQCISGKFLSEMDYEK